MARERHPNHVALVREALDPVHEPRHEKKPRPSSRSRFPGSVGSMQAFLEIEAESLVEHLENEALLRARRPHLHVRAGPLSIAAQDGVGERFGERDGNVEAGLPCGYANCAHCVATISTTRSM